MVFAGMLAFVAGAADESSDIRALIGHEFDKPGLTVDSGPIVVEKDYALADWVQGEKGGRALLRKRDGKWMVVLCSGDGIKETKTMIEAGVPRPVAQALAERLARAESGLPAGRVRMFARFGAEARPDIKHAGHH